MRERVKVPTRGPTRGLNRVPVRRAAAAEPEADRARERRPGSRVPGEDRAAGATARATVDRTVPIAGDGTGPDRTGPGRGVPAASRRAVPATRCRPPAIRRPGAGALNIDDRARLPAAGDRPARAGEPAG